VKGMSVQQSTLDDKESTPEEKAAAGKILKQHQSTINQIKRDFPDAFQTQGGTEATKGTKGTDAVDHGTVLKFDAEGNPVDQ